MSRIADPQAKSMLLRAAEEVFAEKGLVGAKVEEIARRAGISKGAFYLHFESKEAALKQLVESFLARCHSFFAPPSAYLDLPEEPSDVLEVKLQRDVRIFEFLWNNRALLRILAGCQGEYDYLVLAFRADIAVTTRAWVDHWRDEGVFRRDIDPDLATTLIGGAYHELSMRMLVEEERPPLELWLRFALCTFFRAYGTPAVLEALDFGTPRVHPDTDEARSQRAGCRPIDGWHDQRGRHS